MSQLANLLEAIKNGELSVVAKKLVSMQTEISSALSLINALTTEVQGSSTDPDNQVGTIHSPARPGVINSSLEMFIGNYNVGDMLAGSGKKTGAFYFGAGSPCFFYFMPSDPNHGINKKYLDQVVTPIVNRLDNMINRYGDRVPYTSGSVDICTYIFTSYGSSKSRWLIDGYTSSQETNFNAMDSSESLFWINVNDARCFSMASMDYHIMNLAATRAGFIGRTAPNSTAYSDIRSLYPASEVKDAALLFTNSKLQFDADSRPTWEDTRLGTAKANDELARIKDILDLIPTGGIFSSAGIKHYVAFKVADFADGVTIEPSDYPYFDDRIANTSDSITKVIVGGWATFGTGGEATARQTKFYMDGNTVRAGVKITAGGGGSNSSSTDGHATVLIIALRNGI